jgi:hypothetical protein
MVQEDEGPLLIGQCPKTYSFKLSHSQRASGILNKYQVYLGYRNISGP